MNNCRKFSIVRTMALLVVAIAASISASAQQNDEGWANWWYGGYGGANINLFGGEVHSLNTALSNVAPPNGFTDGMGLGLHIGGLLEYNSNNLLGFTLMAGYDSRKVDFDDVQRTDTALGGDVVEGLGTSFSYLSIEPNIRLNLGNRHFHLMVGPSIGINLGKGFEHSLQPGTGNTTPGSTTAADADNVRSVVFGGQAGLGYDIPLAGPDANPQVLVTPFAQFRIGQDLFEAPSGSANNHSLNTVRAGLAIKFGSAPSAAMGGPGGGDAGFTLRAPPVITGSRRVQETFPMRNYVFFEPGSTSIPSRYTLLSKNQADAFREEQLLSADVSTGSNNSEQLRSRRQMEVYYNLLNVIGDRMRRNPTAIISMTGSANGDAAAGRKMAEATKDYLVNTFGIDQSRIKVDGLAMPANRSGSGSSQGADKKLIDAENHRVAIEGPMEIVEPIKIVSQTEELLDNDVVVTIPKDENVAFWSVEVTGGDAPRTYGPFRNTYAARIDGKELLGSRNSARFHARVSLTRKSGESFTSRTEEFRLVRADDDVQGRANRYSILFEFDESKSVQTYQTFLTETVAPQIPDGATVIIHGHTDVIGDPEYNAKLSQRRSEEAQAILSKALAASGKKVTFDTYGFGEAEARAPFNNNLPEQRFYNRTVVVEVVPKM